LASAGAGGSVAASVLGGEGPVDLAVDLVAGFPWVAGSGEFAASPAPGRRVGVRLVDDGFGSAGV
jgi:hypothetical protein